MGLKLKLIDSSPRTYAEFVARQEKTKRITGVSNTVFANNGTSEPSKNGSYYPLTVTGPTEIEAGKEATYQVTDFKLYPGKEENKEDLAKDKTEVKWVFYIDGVEIKNNTLKYIDLKRFKIKDREDSPTDFMAITDLKKRTDAILKYAILSFNFVREGKSKETTKVTFKLSKWLDRHKVYIEAYRRKPDIKNTAGGATVATIVKAKPEIIKGYWANDKREKITNKTVGYKDTVYMCLQTLGMTDQVVTTELWEEGITFMGNTNSNDETICMNENIEWKITERLNYKKLEIPDQNTEEYKKQREGIWETDPLEMYFTLPSETETTGYKNKFGQLLYLTTNELISEAYFAKEIKQEAIQDSTVQEEEKPKTHEVVSGDNIYELTKRYGIKDWMQFAKDNEVKAPNYWLTIGDTLKLPEEAIIPKKADTKKKEPKPEIQKETVYEQIDSASLGSEVWLIVETANLQGKKCTIEIFDNEELLEDSDDKAITILKDNSEVTKLENITIDDTGKAKVKIKLRKKSDEDFKKQKEKFKDDKIAKLFLKVECQGTGTKNKKEFLDGEEFEIKPNKEWHNPIVNSQIRGWYNPYSSINKKSKIKGWNPFASMKIHKNASENNGDVKKYGKPQRSAGGHSGLDIYAPVGTPIYACVDGIITYHKMYGSKAGFLTQLKGTFKGKTYIFQYLHLMEIEKSKFRFYNNYKNSSKVLNNGWLNYKDIKTPFKDPIANETYSISHSSNNLKIDNNTVDVNLALKIKNGKKVKMGQIIGYTGSTGNSYQGKKMNHLHFGIKDDKGTRISPYELLEEYINLDESGVVTSKKQDGVTPSSDW